MTVSHEYIFERISKVRLPWSERKGFIVFIGNRDTSRSWMNFRVNGQSFPDVDGVHGAHTIVSSSSMCSHVYWSRIEQLISDATKFNLKHSNFRYTVCTPDSFADAAMSLIFPEISNKERLIVKTTPDLVDDWLSFTAKNGNPSINKNDFNTMFTYYSDTELYREFAARFHSFYDGFEFEVISGSNE